MKLNQLFEARLFNVANAATLPQVLVLLTGIDHNVTGASLLLQSIQDVEGRHAKRQPHFQGYLGIEIMDERLQKVSLDGGNLRVHPNDLSVGTFSAIRINELLKNRVHCPFLTGLSTLS